MDPRESPDGRSVYFLEPPVRQLRSWVATTLKRVERPTEETSSTVAVWLSGEADGMSPILALCS